MYVRLGVCHMPVFCQNSYRMPSKLFYRVVGGLLSWFSQTLSRFAKLRRSSPQRGVKYSWGMGNFLSQFWRSARGQHGHSVYD